MKTTKGLLFSSLRSVAIAAYAIANLLPLAANAATVHGTTDAAVLWIGGLSSWVKPGAFEMRNRDRTFIPPFIVVPVGSSIRFPNDDPFYHSIYSNSSADPFDIGYYGPGPGKSVVFNTTGVIEVHCHIHAAMHATIVVADGPYTVAAGGSYALEDIPPGKFTLHAWTPGSGERTVSVNVPSANADVTLNVTR